MLKRHGFQHWEDLYPKRQRAVIEHLLQLSTACSADDKVSEALRAAVLGTAEMAGYLSRWDRWYLKSYESMAGHRFNFTTLTAEPNVWGTDTSGRGTVRRRLAQIEKASRWLHPISLGELPFNDEHESDGAERVTVVCGSSETIGLESGTVDLCLTDPPYHDDVQYGELSLPLRAWAGMDLGELRGEAVVNEATGQNADAGDYRKLLTTIFVEVARTLKDDGHLIFSYANRSPSAWAALLASLQDAGLRACGYAIIHSENELDSAKRGVRACNLDLILDLTPAESELIQAWTPLEAASSDEADFLRVVGTYLMRVGTLGGSWEATMSKELSNTRFLAPKRKG